MRLPIPTQAFDPSREGQLYLVTMAACSVAAIFQAHPDWLAGNNPLFQIAIIIGASIFFGVVDVAITFGIYWLLSAFLDKFASLTAALLSLPFLALSWLSATNSPIQYFGRLNICWIISITLHSFLLITMLEEFEKRKMKRFCCRRPTSATIMTNKRDFSTIVFGVMVALTSRVLLKGGAWGGLIRLFSFPALGLYIM